MKKILFLSAFISASLAASAHMYTGVSGGYFKNDDFKGGMGGLCLGYSLGHLEPNITHGLEFEVMAGELTGKTSESFSGTKDGSVGTSSNFNKVRVMPVPLMINYRINMALDQDKLWNLSLGLGAGAQYLDFKWTNTRALLTNGNPVSTTEAGDKAAWEIVFKSNNPIVTEKRDSWAAVGNFFAELDCHLTQNLSLGVRLRALLNSKKEEFSSKYPINAASKSVIPATVKWGNFQYGIEAVLNYAL
jgi:hypothetical protein